MIRWKSVFTLCVFLLLLGLPAPFQSPGTLRPVQAATPRLVVFESFIDPTDINCRYVGPVVEQLAGEYAAAGKPVVFIEHEEGDHSSGRDLRFWVSYYAINGNTGAVMPLNMVDSGYQVSEGGVDFYNVYKGMVDTELARAPEVNVSATYIRVANHLEANVTVENLSGVDLSSTTNNAGVGILVYEDIKVGLTGRYARAVVPKPLTLLDKASTVINLKTGDLTSVVDWGKLHVIAYVEYNPGYNFADPFLSTKPFDMLQAAVASELSLTTTPYNPSLTVTQLSPGTYEPIDMDQTVQIAGKPIGTTWALGSTLPSWMTVMPTSGQVNSSVQIQVKGSGLQHGMNVGTLQFVANRDGLTVISYLTVSVTYDWPKLTFSPSSLANIGLPSGSSGNVKVATLKIDGNFSHLPWSVDTATTPSWVILTPTMGEAGDSADVFINTDALSTKNNVGMIGFKAYTSKATASVAIPISIMTETLFLPCIYR